MAQSPNPLSKFFRQPAIYVKLPSQGKYYPQGTLTMPPNGELPIFPMTALDEIIARTPDALFNGSTTIEIIKSCVPNILDPWQMPQTDVDMLLTAIRIASYGHEMEMASICPACKEEHEFALDLRNVIDRYKPANFETPCVIGDLTVYFKPITYQQMNLNSMRQFEEQKALQVSDDATVEITPEQRADLLKRALTNLTKLTLESMAHSIVAIKTPDGVVDNFDHIREFVQNCDKNVFDRMRDHLIAIREGSEMEFCGWHSKAATYFTVYLYTKRRKA